MKPVRLDFCDFWPGFRKDDNRIYNLLKTRFAVELCDRPDFVIYSSFGDHHRLHSCTRIFFTGESQSPDFSTRSEEHTSELQSLTNLVCRLLLEKKKNIQYSHEHQ